MFARALVLLPVIALAACASETPTATDVSLLFSQTAGTARLEPVPAGNSYSLTLAGVDRRVVQFADRPARFPSTLPVGDFVESWSGIFGDDPPNAALVGHQLAADGADTLILTLANPVVINGCVIQQRTNCRQANLSDDGDGDRIVLDGVDLSGAVLDGADLSNAGFSNVNLSDASLIGANMRGATLVQSDLTRAVLRFSTMTVANLSGARLDGAELSGANLSDARMSGITMVGATLNAANLSFADLSGHAQLVGADLTEATFAQSDLTDAVFTNATGFNPVGAYLCNTTMPDGSINNTSC